MTNVNKILIKTPNWLGDCVMSIPAVNGIRKLFPDAEISVWTKPKLNDFWQMVPSVDHCVNAPRKKYYDLGILLTNSFGSALRMFLKRIPLRVGYKINGRTFLLNKPVSLKDNWRSLHQIGYFLGIVEYLANISPDKLGVNIVPKLEISKSLKEETSKYINGFKISASENIIGIHATASYGPAKCWGSSKYSLLIKRLKEMYDPWILMVGSKAEGKAVEDILACVNDQNKVINLAGKTGINQLAGVSNLCRVFIANDSGPMHLAASAGVPVVAIFGSTDPKRTAPSSNCIIVRNDVPCSPCFRRVCNKEMECMKKINVEDVMNAVGIAMNKER